MAEKYPGWCVKLPAYLETYCEQLAKADGRVVGVKLRPSQALLSLIESGIEQREQNDRKS